MSKNTRAVAFEQDHRLRNDTTAALVSLLSKPGKETDLPAYQVMLSSET